MTDTGSNPDPGGQSGAPSPGAAPDSGGSNPEPSKFTQEHVARLLADEKRKATAPFADYDAIKAKLADLEAAGQSEQEKLTTKLAKATKDREQAIQERDQLRIRTAVTTAAVRAGAVDPDVVVALLADSLKIDADGGVEGDVNKLVAQLLEERPFLKANGTGPPGRGAADGGAHSRSGSQPVTPSSRMDDVLRGNR